MAYSDNPITLQRLLPQLQPLAEGMEEVTWSVPFGRAKWWAHRVREALRLARAMPSAPEGLKREITVKVLSPSYVRARVREAAAPALDWSTDPFDQEAVRLSALVQTKQISSSDWLDQIKGQWFLALERGDRKLYLPKAWADRSQLLSLWEWTEAEGMIFFENEGSVTLMEREGNEKVATYSWSPEEDQ